MILNSFVNRIMFGDITKNMQSVIYLCPRSIIGGGSASPYIAAITALTSEASV